MNSYDLERIGLRFAQILNGRIRYISFDAGKGDAPDSLSIGLVTDEDDGGSFEIPDYFPGESMGEEKKEL